MTETMCYGLEQNYADYLRYEEERLKKEKEEKQESKSPDDLIKGFGIKLE